jgi:hypothetical protein
LWLCQEVSAVATTQRDVVFQRAEAPTLQTAALDSPGEPAHKEIRHEEDLFCGFDPRTIVWCFGCSCATHVKRTPRRKRQQLRIAQREYGDGDGDSDVGSGRDDLWNRNGNEDDDGHNRNRDGHRTEGWHEHGERSGKQQWHHNDGYRIGDWTAGQECQRLGVGYE